MADIEEQMEMFGYTAEGAKQEAKKLASGVNTDLTFKEAATTVGSMLPGIGTAMTVAEIEEELKKEDPSYGKIALLGGSEVIGLIPGLGTAAKSALKAAAKKIGANKIIDALDAPKPKTESKIMIGPAGGDYYNENLDKAIELEKQGVSPGKIEAQTGRVKSGGEIMDDYVDFPTFDPVFKFEIDDTRSKLYGKYQTSGGDAFTPPTFAKTRDATEKNPAYLGQVLDHPILFEQYPDLKQVKFAFDDLEPGELGVFSRQKNMVILSSKYKKFGINDSKLRNVLFHEIQHAAQFQDFKNQGYQMLSGGPDYFAKVVGEPNRYMGSSNVEAQLNANALLNDDKIIAARDDVLNFYNKYKDTGDLSYIMTFPDGMKKTLSPTDQLAPIDAFGVQMLAGQKLSMKFKNRKVATEYAQKMSNLQNELFRKYIEIGAEVEARVVGKRAKNYGYNPDAMKVPISSQVGKQRQIKTKQEYSKDRPDNFFTKKLKFFKEKIGVKEKFPETEIHRHLNDGILFGRYASGQDAELGFAEGGAMMRPEPRDGVDISPRAEAGDQFFVEQAERKRAFETKPMPRPSMDKSFPNVKPKPRPEEQGGLITKEFEIDGEEVLVPIIKFKDGEEIAFEAVIQKIRTRGTANEPTVGKATERQILNFIKQKNPTREEFETYWYNKRLNKGGIIDDQMQMAFMNEGGLTDDGMDVDPVSGNDVPSGSMAEEVRDDIPAQLSDGEYVVPADVVRYYGVKFFEDLRDTAKIGLQDMEMNGRIGGEPVPDGGPTNNNGLSPQEMQALQEVMGMYGGGDVEENILDAGNKAISDPYIGQDLGFSIFGDSNTGVQTGGVQQTEVKPFTSITLYNTSGQTRLVNSEAEKTKAIADDYTMTLSEYNMYRSKTVGGSGGSGTTPPGEGEDGEVKPWGQDLKNWNNVDDIKQFVAQAERGNLSGSGTFLRGAGFALAEMTGVALAGAFQSFKGISSLYDMEAAQIIAEAKGKAGSKEHADLAVKIQTGIDTYLEKAGGLVNFAYQPRSKNVMNKVNGVFVGTDYEDVNSWAAGTRKAGITKGTTGAFDPFKTSATQIEKQVKAAKEKRKKNKVSEAEKARLRRDASSGTGAFADRSGTSAKDRVSNYQKPKGEIGSQMYRGQGGRAEGGLMTKGKKK